MFCVIVCFLLLKGNFIDLECLLCIGELFNFFPFIVYILLFVGGGDDID